MARLKIKLNFKRLQKKLEKARPKVRAAARDAINECAINLQRAARMNAPVDTTRLRADIQIEFFDGGMAADVGNTVDYAPHVEFGTGPHQARKGQADFIRGIERWAKRKLGLEPDEIYPILRKIRQKGTPAQPYLTPAWESIRDDCRRLIAKAVFKGAEEALD